jgi:aspartate racemase
VGTTLKLITRGRMKTIGVLGGLGPQATIDFEQRLHLVAQQLIPQRGNAAYPPMVSWFFRELPVLVPPGSPAPATLPPLNPRLLDAARALGQHADLIAMPVNGVHLWQAEIEQAAGKPVVSMIDAVLNEVQRRGCRRVGLVDFRPPAWSVYPRLLEQREVAWVELPDALRNTMASVQRAVVEGRNTDGDEAQVQRAIRLLRAAGTDGIILACTEFPLALTTELDADIINPAALLAEVVVRAALA